MTTREKLDLIATTLMVAAVVGISGIVISRHRVGDVARSTDDDGVDGWERFATGHVLGLEGAPVSIIEFADYECEWCARAYPVLKRVLEARSGELALIYRHFPIPAIHPNATAAALGAICAAEQGVFESYHHLMYTQRDLVVVDRVEDAALRAGTPDMRAFRECLERESTHQRLQADVDAGIESGVTGTPTFLLGGRRIVGIPAEAELNARIDEALRSAR